MKILHITASYKPAYIYGGPVMSVSQLCENLARAGNEVTVYTTTANGDKELDITAGVEHEVEGVSVYYFKRITKDHTHFSPSLLSALWNNGKRFDVVHIHSWWNLVSVLSALVCWLKGIKVVLSPRGMLSNYTYQTNHSWSKKILNAVIGNFLLKKSHFHATSTHEKDEIENGFPESKVTVVPNFVKLPSSSYERKDNTVFRLIFFSRIDPKKGLELLIDALKDFHKEYSLTIAGNGNEQYIQSLKNAVGRAGITNKVKWIGAIQGEEKFKVLSEHDLMVLPSHNENFANVVIESLSVGTPVLISSKVGLSDYVIQNNFGWVSDVQPDDILKKIELAYNDANRRKETYYSAPQQIKNDFSVSRLVSLYEGFYLKN